VRLASQKVEGEPQGVVAALGRAPVGGHIGHRSQSPARAGPYVTSRPWPQCSRPPSPWPAGMSFTSSRSPGLGIPGEGLRETPGSVRRNRQSSVGKPQGAPEAHFSREHIRGEIPRSTLNGIRTADFKGGCTVDHAHRPLGKRPPDKRTVGIRARGPSDRNGLQRCIPLLGCWHKSGTPCHPLVKAPGLGDDGPMDGMEPITGADAARHERRIPPDVFPQGLKPVATRSA
jgi:hypothetical protein